jgi:transcriptional regulator of acetoin/glycerol metabolism
MMNNAAYAASFTIVCAATTFISPALRERSENTAVIDLFVCFSSKKWDALRRHRHGGAPCAGIYDYPGNVRELII